MEELSFFVGVIGNVISVLVFLSPVGTFWRIIKHGSTENFETRSLPCRLATVNGFGILAEAVYVALFLIYAPRKIRVKTGILVGILDVGFLAAAILVTRLALEGESRIDAIGFMCAGLNIIMYGSPLAAMKTVVSSKSVEYMPFFLSFFLFLNGGIWAFYALLEQDIFLGVPNGIGFLLGTAQLILYAIYSNARPSSNSISQGLLEQGLQK
ncbi:hypothetical protein like AT4G15920 [Hibiscus trionum]|uniref:Bidirectional sugar transporter SWEET n=1 Tax=Hibiscus trionum TaxID=183268 RepID=A0A9W7HMG5_HIBTR|nr:hypothetical protein like AT4G15920 [Hibiscus trionum]